MSKVAESSPTKSESVTWVVARSSEEETRVTSLWESKSGFEEKYWKLCFDLKHKEEEEDGKELRCGWWWRRCDLEVEKTRGVEAILFGWDFTRWEWDQQINRIPCVIDRYVSLEESI